MVFGHNTNLKLGDMTFHVQTEDRGESHALIDTTVYFHGRVLHRRTNNYFDLLPMNKDREQALRLRLDDQHRTVIEEIRSGVLQLAVPTVPDSAHVEGKPSSPPQPRRLRLELVNAKSWLSGKHATLQVLVRELDGAPVPGATVRVGFEGSETAQSHEGRTDAQGVAQIEFELPRIISPETALLISAENHAGAGHLRFALRSKPRVLSK